MKIRYKKTGTLGNASYFNINAMAEVLTGDDSAFVSELDVFLDSKNMWKDMRQSFSDKDLIIDNYNTRFFEPNNEEDKERGYTL
jgi:hypothetical protein